MSRTNCPICLEDIHTSRIPSHIPSCGHLIHRTCFNSFIHRGHYACPVCQTSMMPMESVHHSASLHSPIRLFMWFPLFSIGVFWMMKSRQPQCQWSTKIILSLFYATTVTRLAASTFLHVYFQFSHSFVIVF